LYSFSQAWNGDKGILDLNNAFADRDFKGNTFRAWGKTNQIAYYPLMDKVLLKNNMHIIVTIRSKTDHQIMVNEFGKMTGVQKVGLKGEQRDGVIYEF